MTSELASLRQSRHISASRLHDFNLVTGLQEGWKQDTGFDSRVSLQA